MATNNHDSQTPARGQQIISVAAFIHSEFDGRPKVFMAKRADIKKFLPGVYELPGGHVEFGENIILALKREINEELDMDVSIGDAFYTFSYMNEVKGSHSIEVIYFGKFIGLIEDVHIQPEDHSVCGWFEESEIESFVVPTKDVDDPEWAAIHRGFELLNTGKLNFG